MAFLFSRAKGRWKAIQDNNRADMYNTVFAAHFVPLNASTLRKHPER